MAINWQNLIALILQILAALKPATPTGKLSANFDDHRAALRTELANAGVATDLIEKAIAMVEKDWVCISTIVTDAERLFA